MTPMRRCLIVEDDPDIVELVTHYLSKEGWRVEASGDGRKALERIRGSEGLSGNVGEVVGRALG